MKLKLYDEFDNKLAFDNLRILSNGESGIVYKLDDYRVLKHIIDGYSYDIEAIKTINYLNLPNFGKIYQLLYGNNFEFSGYIMEYYKREIKDILTTPTEYTIENLYQIIKSARKISEAKILIKDLHDGNVILSNDMIRVIDYDMYKNITYDIETLTNYNNESIIFLFKLLYISALKEYHEINHERSMRINELFSLNKPITEIAKKLVKYKYPIDYVK